MPTSGMIKWRLYRSTSSFESVTGGLPAGGVGVTPVFVAMEKFSSKSNPRAACDRRHDADDVAFAHARLILLQVANILVIYVHVDETAQLPIIRIKMFF